MNQLSRQSELLRSQTNLRHGFFGRVGGISTGIYRSLNCGFGSSDDNAAIEENRKRVASAIGIKASNLINLYQIHSNDAINVTVPWPREQAPEADAMVTTQKGIALAILTADCGPILFSDAENSVIGAAHAGWRGAQNGIIRTTIEAMLKLGAKTDNIKAVLGPTISQANYEVDEGFKAGFLANQASTGQFFDKGCRDGHFQFDLPGYIISELNALGITTVENLDLCTYEDPDSYFSYRRSTHLSEPDYGRNISVIALTE